MSSAFGGLNTVVRGLMAQQISLNTVGHNISNASTDGYSRQSVNLVSSLPEPIMGSNGQMQLGTGVDMQSITRARDTFMDLQLWKENSTLGYGETQQSLLSEVEGVFHEPSATGVQTVLNQFWSSWQSLGTNASDDSTRNLVLQRGVALANAVEQAASQLKDTVTSINTDLQLKLSNVNQITSDILSLNKMISMSETVSAGPGSANDLRDQRDLLVDQLSKYVSIRVTEDSTGNYNIQSGSLNLVNSHAATQLTTYSTKDPDYDYEVLNVQANGKPVTLSGGELEGLVDTRDDSNFGVKGYLDKLTTVSQFLLKDFNAIHRAGYGEDDTLTGLNFFEGTDTASINFYDAQYSDPTNAAYMTKGEWMSALKVNAKFLDQTTNPPGLQMIAAKTKPSVNLADPTEVQGNASGDNAVKLAQALKMNTAGLLPDDPASTTTPKAKLYQPSLGTTASLDSYYSAVIGALGVQGQSAGRLVENQKTLVAQIESWRQSTSGVNMDEEMSNMIKFQKGYNAAARVLTTMDEMLDKLINSTGVVGR